MNPASAPQPNPKLVFLTGMPAAGKTYWGRRLAGAWDWQFTDLDAYIELREQAAIPDLFSRVGEAGFRQIERACLLAAIQQAGGNTIFACGGGLPCFYDNMQVMKAAGAVIYLDVPPKALAQRLKASGGTRPLLAGTQNVVDKLEELLLQRRHYYEQAHYILQPQNISLTTFAEILLLNV